MAVATDPNPQEQMVELNQQLQLMTKQLAEFKEMLQETKIANKNIELQLNQAKQQLSKQDNRRMPSSSTKEWEDIE